MIVKLKRDEMKLAELWDITYVGANSALYAYPAKEMAFACEKYLLLKKYPELFK